MDERGKEDRRRRLRAAHPGWEPSQLRRYYTERGMRRASLIRRIQDIDPKTVAFTPPSPSQNMVMAHERGDYYPGDDWQRAYCHVLKATPSDLGFYTHPADSERHTAAAIVLAAELPDVRSTPTNPGARAYSRDEGSWSDSPRDERVGDLMSGVDDTIGFITRAQRADSEIMDLLKANVRAVAADFQAPSSRFVPTLMTLRRATFRLLDNPTAPDQARDLYFFAAVVCGLITNAALDAAQPATADIYGRAAWLCAERAGHPGLRCTIRTQQGRVAYWTGAPREALEYFALAEADATRIRGSGAAQLAVQQARAHAVLGDEPAMRAALNRADDARQHFEPDDIDDLGGAIYTTTVGEQLWVAADALSYLGDHTATASAADAAITVLDTPDFGGSDYGNLAGARSVLSLAQARQGDAEAANVAITPVLTLPAGQIYHGIRKQMHRILRPLTAPQLRDSRAARSLAADLESATQTTGALRIGE